MKKSPFFMAVLVTGVLFVLPFSVWGAPIPKSAAPKANPSHPVSDTLSPFQEILSPALSSDFVMTCDLPLKAPYIYLIDDETKTVLLARNSDKRMGPASMTKMMTAYMVTDRIKSGNLAPDQQFIVSDNAFGCEGSTTFLNKNDPVSVQDLLKGLIIQSGNDASIVLAENISGSEGQFAALMTQKAHEWGAIHTHFVNASGLPHPNHYTTCQDLALISHHVIHDYPDYYIFYKEKSFSFGNITQLNRNPLLSKNIGCDGIKTGHTQASGYGMAASCVHDNRRVILIIHGLHTDKERAAEALKIMIWAQNTFSYVKVMDKMDKAAEIPVRYGAKDVVMLRPIGTCTVITPKGQEKTIQKEIITPTLHKGPVKEGDVLGVMKISAPFLKAPLMINLVAAETIEQASVIKRLWQDISAFFGSTT